MKNENYIFKIYLLLLDYFCMKVFMGKYNFDKNLEKWIKLQKMKYFTLNKKVLTNIQLPTFEEITFGKTFKKNLFSQLIN